MLDPDKVRAGVDPLQGPLSRQTHWDVDPAKKGQGKKYWEVAAGEGRVRRNLMDVTCPLLYSVAQVLTIHRIILVW